MILIFGQAVALSNTLLCSMHMYADVGACMHICMHVLCWQNGEDTALNNSIEWLSNNSRDNYIVPDLYTGYHGSSVYQASPGGTLQLLSLPLSYFWDSRYIQDLYKNFDEIILCWDPAQVSLISITFRVACVCKHS